MTEFFDVLAGNGWLIVASVFSLWIVCATAESIVKAFGREKTKREIAAYIAEGSMSPEEGERIIRAKPGKGVCEDA